MENAIRYGLEENTEGCLISISAEACPEKDQLIIYVKNDGSAFEDDLLSKLENRQIEPHGFGIGLLNIQKRMQITYGEAYGLTLYKDVYKRQITDWYRTQSYYDSGDWRATWEGEGGGVLLNQCPHNLDLIQWICGMPSKVQAF